MVDKADAVVIGSGGLGAATAFYLVALGMRSVVLVDQHAIGSQTSPRAAGMVSCLRKGGFMTELIKLAAKKIPHFTEETGQPLDWVHSGSLKIARRAEDARVLKDDLQRGRAHDLDVEEISPQDAHRLNPFLEPHGIAAALRIGDDMYFDPAQVAVGFARGAEARGATVLSGTRVNRIIIENGKVSGVETTKGRIDTPVAVDAAGAWTREVAESSGIRVPILPTMQQLIVTEPIPDARADLPIVRIMDAAVYIRPCHGGFLWGVYEEKPRFFDMRALGPSFQVKDMPLDAEILWSYADEVKSQFPILRKAKVKEHRGGIPTMTGDGQHIVGPAPDAEGFFFASGCNVAGLSISPALGEALARWIAQGKPPMDLSPLSIERFSRQPWDEAELRKQAAWQYRHFYGAV
jgi:glycine/D-amino acid oxidase-like deaminating enzyme